MRLIDGDALLRDIEHYHLSDGKFQHWVEIQPTIEERKTGKWIPFDIPWYQCSECGAVAEFLFGDVREPFERPEIKCLEDSVLNGNGMTKYALERIMMIKSRLGA